MMKIGSEQISIDKAYLFIDVCLDNLDKASEIIDDDPDILRCRTLVGETPLHWMVIENQLEVAQFLHAKGAELNTVSDDGYTPLSQAAHLGYPEMVKFLLANGAAVEGIFIAGETILHEAVRSGNPNIVETLVASGADIHSTNALRQTPLHASSSCDAYLPVTRYLVSIGADMDATAAFNETPLLIAARNGAAETGMYLVRSGADVHVRNSKGHTARDVAVMHDFHAFLFFLKTS